MINASSGLLGEDIRGMVKDNDGLIWASTSARLNRINPDGFEVSRFFTEEKAFNRLSAFSSLDNRAYFGSNR